MKTYKLTNLGEPGSVLLDPGPNQLLIPPTRSNRHYLDYLQWLAEGNEPLPADDVDPLNAPDS